MDTVPDVIATKEGTWRVRRAWPDDTSVTFEAADTKRLIGGRWDPRTGATLVEPARDRRLPGLARLDSTASVVSYRPGKRAVAYSTMNQTYTKIVRPGRARRVLDGVKRGAVFDSVFRTPHVVAHGDDTVTFKALGGHTFHDLAPQVDEAEWRRLWSAWAERWAAGTQGSSDAPVHGPEDEADVLRAWQGHVRRLLAPDLALDEGVAAIAEALLGGPADPFVPAHRDLHDKQLLWDADDGFGLLDVDTACRAEAALDLGNLRAHALLRGLQGLYGPGHVRTVREAVDSVAGRLSVSPGRLAAYEQAAVLRLGCVYAFRPMWRDIAATLRAHRARR